MTQPEATGRHQPTRRQVVRSGATLAVALAMPFRGAWGGRSGGPFTRYEVSSPEGKQMLASYQIAIGKLLALPPTDPRNWYRNAMVHQLDCPHMNWWLFPWHRAYIGWFEQTCRDMSGNPMFTFPYWDWTANPVNPAEFADGLLNPSNPHFVKGYTDFYEQINAPMATFWNGLSTVQKTGLSLRGYNSMDDVWKEVQGAFTDAGAQARFTPGFSDCGLVKAVSKETILAGLKPSDYVSSGPGTSFSSGATLHHQDPTQGATVSILEGSPHNLVHNNMGLYMPDFLSPVDPLFFAHHSNLERLWCLWQAQSGATLPPADSPWRSEQFTFFSGRDGQPVQQNTCDAYVTTSLFNYVYTPGSCSEILNAPPRNHALQATRHVETPATLSTDAKHIVHATISQPQALLTANLSGGPLTSLLHVTVSTGEGLHGESLDVYLNLPTGVTASPNRPEFVGSLQFFGSHKHPAGASTTFTLPVLSSTSTAIALKSSKPLHVQVVPVYKKTAAHPMSSGQEPSLKVTAVSLTTS